MARPKFEYLTQNIVPNLLVGGCGKLLIFWGAANIHVRSF
ncbi:hypothetical protein FORC066_2622 [Yersinia enterocolitica]|nr:hypothetical protein FORC066_2622 [Yersinia enterocolitica]